MRSRLITLLSMTLVLAACGGNEGAITIGSSAPPNSFDHELCSEFDATDGPSKELINGLPSRFKGAITAVVDFGSAMDAMGDNDDGSVDDLIELLSRKDLGDQFRELSAFVEKECGSSEGSASISALATAADVAAEPADDAYCAALQENFAGSGTSDDETTTDDRIDALVEVAPESHRAALDELRSLGGSADDSESLGAFGALLGLGVYAQSRCDIDGALAQMLLGGMFAGLGDASGDSPTTTASGPAPDADATAATAAVPAGTDLAFEVRSADLDDDGAYLASVVVPVGWEAESNFDVSFSPPAGSGAGIFTSLDVGAGCDGVCEPTDWEARLRGESGYLTSYLAAHAGASERPVVGSDGTAILSTDGEVAGLVVRWDDTAAKYFTCEVRLEDDQADLLQAFVTACESARPAWIPVA